MQLFFILQYNCIDFFWFLTFSIFILLSQFWILCVILCFDVFHILLSFQYWINKTKVSRVCCIETYFPPLASCRFTVWSYNSWSSSKTHIPDGIKYASTVRSHIITPSRHKQYNMSSHFGPAVKCDCLLHPTTTHCKNYRYINPYPANVEYSVSS